LSHDAFHQEPDLPRISLDGPALADRSVTEQTPLLKRQVASTVAFSTARMIEAGEILILSSQNHLDDFRVLEQNFIFQPSADDLHVARRPFDLIRLVCRVLHVDPISEHA
jgi:hypothetical protein